MTRNCFPFGSMGRDSAVVPRGTSQRIVPVLRSTPVNTAHGGGVQGSCEGERIGSRLIPYGVPCWGETSARILPSFAARSRGKYWPQRGRRDERGMAPPVERAWIATLVASALASYRSSLSSPCEAGTDGLTGTSIPDSTQAFWLGANRGASNPSLISLVTAKRLNCVAGIFFFLMTRQPPRATLFPYTTLFR